MSQQSYENKMFNGMRSLQKMNYANRVAYYRSLMYDIYVSRLVEILPYLITYENLPETLSALQIENQLRIFGQDLIIGPDKYDRLVVLGTPSSISRNFRNYPLVNGIIFTVDETQRLERDKYVQILPTNPHEGNYILLQNRFSPYYLNDLQIIDAYAITLSEIKKSRYSLILQSNVLTYFRGVNAGDNNTLNHLMDDVMNGVPFVKLESTLNLEDDFGTMDNAQVIPPMLTGGKEEFNNNFNEMLNMIGVLNNGVDKSSGITEYEATANQGFMNAVTNIYIKTRQDAFDLLNANRNLDIKVKSDSGMTAQAITTLKNTTKGIDNEFGGEENDPL